MEIFDCRTTPFSYGGIMCDMLWIRKPKTFKHLQPDKQFKIAASDNVTSLDKTITNPRRCEKILKPECAVKMDSIFHEQQEGALCAQHCLNSLLQGQYYTAVDLADIARQLDDEERRHRCKIYANE